MSVVIGSVVIGAPAEHSENRPAIGYDSFVPDATLTASSTDTGFDVENVADWLTWDFWRANAGDAAAWVAAEASAPVAVDYCGIAAHNLGSIGATIEVQAYIGAAWQTQVTLTPADDTPIMASFSEIEATEWRVLLSGYTGQPEIGILNLGIGLRLQRNIYVGHSPINLSRRTEIKPNVSQGGQFLGRSIERRGAETTISIQNLTPAWYRATFEPFVQHALTKGFFFAWRPEDYPLEAAYVWTTDDIRPVNQRNNGMMSVSFRVEGLTE